MDNSNKIIKVMLMAGLAYMVFGPIGLIAVGVLMLMND